MANTELAADLTPDGALVELFFGSGVADPNPYYHFLRDQAPIHHSGTGGIFLSRFDDCQQILRDNRFGKSSRASGGGVVPDADPAVAEYRREQARRVRESKQPVSMLFLNPPHHTRQRGLVNRAFTPRRVEQLRSSIRGLADDAVKRLVDAGSCDLLEELAFPLPVAVIGTMVGVPQADWPQFRSLISTSAGGIEFGASLEEVKAAEAASAEVRSYFMDLVAERRVNPQDDLLSDLIGAKEAGDSLSDGEIIAVAILLFAAGFETTTNLIGNGVGALLRHPDQMAKLWADPSLSPGAVEEILRWDSPVQLDARVALEDADFAGEAVEAGQQFVTLLGGANRDPEHFADPDRFDITRDQGPPLSFASGIHYCLGANLSRVEGIEVLESLITHCNSIELDGALVQRPRMTLRGYESVPVNVTAR